MGLLKLLAFTVGPASLLVYSAFRLGNRLPVASRLMGNYIGLGYVYFKVALKTLRPAHDLGVEIVDVVRKTSQQVWPRLIEDQSLTERTALCCLKSQRLSQTLCWRRSRRIDDCSRYKEPCQ